MHLQFYLATLLATTTVAIPAQFPTQPLTSPDPKPANNIQGLKIYSLRKFKGQEWSLPPLPAGSCYDFPPGMDRNVSSAIIPDRVGCFLYTEHGCPDYDKNPKKGEGSMWVDRGRKKAIPKRLRSLKCVPVPELRCELWGDHSGCDVH